MSSMVVKSSFHNGKNKFPWWYKSIDTVVKINFQRFPCAPVTLSFHWSALAVKLQGGKNQFPRLVKMNFSPL